MYAILLDTVPMILAFLLLNAAHPGVVMRGADSNFGRGGARAGLKSADRDGGGGPRVGTGVVAGLWGDFADGLDDLGHIPLAVAGPGDAFGAWHVLVLGGFGSDDWLVVGHADRTESGVGHGGGDAFPVPVAVDRRGGASLFGDTGQFRSLGSEFPLAGSGRVACLFWGPVVPMFCNH